ncbi:MAG TPA: PDR/VanB family oxidoreductase [Alphaproteobacteria bacterium]|jgi:vanillate O-demethylase ferredoxin subunit|nr:PDR/VanB family oxidoreductase [Alphaproteobacteria bacterium]
MNPTDIDARLISISYETEGINVYEFADAAGGMLPPAAAGSHIGLHLPGIGERHYSLLPGNGTGRYSVGVLRDEAGRGGSRHVHDQLKVGQVLRITPPRNLFPLTEDAAHSAFFAGGIGVTPLLNMAARLAELGRPFEFHYACRSRAGAAFLKEIAALTAPGLHFDDEAGSVFDFPSALSRVPAEAHLYCCGPVPMMDAFTASARAQGFPDDRIHLEYFSAKEAPATAGGFTVELARSKRSIPVKPGQSILAALRTAGVGTVSSCEQGICGACEVRVISGVPDHRDSILSDAERAENTVMMLCCSGAKTPVLVIDL